MPLKRTASGLLLQEGFADLSAWVSDGTWTATADPSLVVFDPSPILAQAPGINGTADYDGVREGQIYIESGAWTMLYDAGDGTSGWHEFTATSLDRGLTWTKNLGQSIGYNNGSGGTYAATATGWLEKRGATYFLHRVTANAVYANPIGQGLPQGPYMGDIWTATSIAGSWTYLRAYPNGSGWANGQNLPGSVYFDGTSYHMFNEGFNGTIGRYSGATIAGGWTEDTTAITGYLADGRYVENPKVFLHPTLGRYVMLANAINTSGQADQNTVWLSVSLTNWAGASVHRIQHICPLDSPNAVGVISHLTGPDGALVVESDGSMPVIYDGLPRGNAGAGYHLGRSIQYAVLEAAANCVRYSASDTTARRLRRTKAHTTIVAEWTAELRSINGANGALTFEFRRTDDSNYYRLVLTAGGGLHLDKVLAGVSTTLQSAASPTETGSTNLVHRLRLVANGTALDAWLNGEHQISTTDSTYAGGVGVAFTATDLDGDIRCFSLRTGQSVTLASVTPGDVLTLRGAGGVPIQSITAGSTTATLSASHYPQYRIDRNGVDITPPGGVWGGDVYNLDAPIGQYPFG